MDAETRQARIETYHRLCRDHGLRNTVQKRIILETVLDHGGHPTADEIHELVLRANPDISRTTVYRALESFIRLGLVTKACHPGRVVRYDCRVDIHHHLLCLRCNRFVDFEDHGLDRLAIPDTSAVGFEVSDFSVQLRGICRSCRETTRREESS